MLSLCNTEMTFLPPTGRAFYGAAGCGTWKGRGVVHQLCALGDTLNISDPQSPHLLRIEAIAALKQNLGIAEPGIYWTLSQ